VVTCYTYAGWLGVQRSPISSQLLDIVVDSVSQFLGISTVSPPTGDEIAPEPVKLDEVRSNASDSIRLPTLLLVVFAPSLRGCSVLCLRHGAIEQ